MAITLARTFCVTSSPARRWPAHVVAQVASSRLPLPVPCQAEVRRLKVARKNALGTLPKPAAPDVHFDAPRGAVRHSPHEPKYPYVARKANHAQSEATGPSQGSQVATQVA
eukprot:scaffold1108_cov387-Prasinococcus_capsulatus_cf.AAC.11